MPDIDEYIEKRPNTFGLIREKEKQTLVAVPKDKKIQIKFACREKKEGN